jgi:hypothetical protein
MPKHVEGTRAKLKLGSVPHSSFGDNVKAADIARSPPRIPRKSYRNRSLAGDS